MEIRQIYKRFRVIDEKLNHPKGKNDVKDATSEFNQLKIELEEKGFPLKGIVRETYSTRYGQKTIDYLNEMSRT